MNELLTAALGYIHTKSWPVFPVGADKAPLVKGGFKSASRDPRMVKEWWRLYPEAGIGFAIPEGVLVVDVDPRNGGSLPRGLPDTLTSKTRSDGTHSYFVVPAGLSFVGQAATGVDLKSAGKGYVILPPTPGYAWVRQGQMKALPDSFVVDWERSTYPLANGDGETQPAAYLPWENGTRYGLAALQRAVAEIGTLGNGERHTRFNAIVFSLARLIAGGELREDASLQALHEAGLEVGLDKVRTCTRHCGMLPQPDTPNQGVLMADDDKLTEILDALYTLAGQLDMGLRLASGQKSKHEVKVKFEEHDRNIRIAMAKAAQAGPED